MSTGKGSAQIRALLVHLLLVGIQNNNLPVNRVQDWTDIVAFSYLKKKKKKDKPHYKLYI